MLTRRLVRIKTLQALYAWQQSDGVNIDKGIAVLRNNMLHSYEFYQFLLEFPWYFGQYLESEKDIEKSKYYPNKELIREYGHLAGNVLAEKLFERCTARKRKLFSTEWATLAQNFDTLFQELRKQDFVIDYLVFDKPDFEQQKHFLEQLFGFFINNCEPFYLLMEETFFAWNDDEELLLKEILRTINNAPEEGNIRLAEQDTPASEDILFGLKLFENVAANGKAYEDRIAEITDNWDPTRIAILDLIAIKMALDEFLHFPEIPLKVTINEYLDIIKDYSTPNSSRFLNGVLDKMRKKLEGNGEIRKVGRGLREN